KQRVGIARALANNPKVLLCDEATSALDPDTTNAILDLLLDINKKLGLTIILITHEMHVIRKICNRVAVMEAGSVIEQDDVMEVVINLKHDMTKKFVDQVFSEADDDEIMDYNMNLDNKVKIVRVHFIGDAANEAVISDVAKKFSVTINTLQGKLTQTISGVLGTLTIKLQWEKEAINVAITLIENTT